MYALLLQVLADAPLTQFFVFLAEAGVGLGKGRVVQVAVLAEARDDGGDDCLTPLIWFDAGLHQAAQLGLGTHLAAQRLHGVVEEAGFIEEGTGLGGFALKRQLLAPNF
jgi:hypothetical protein